MAPPEPEKQMPKYVKFILGGLAGMMAKTFVQPLDLMKSRMQLSGVGSAKKEFSSSYQVFRDIVHREGVLGLYNGISAGYLRQATYTTTRLGVYTWLFESYSTDGVAPNFASKAAMGMFAGICGAFVGTPADLCLIRMMADGKLPKDQQRNYRHVFDALSRIIREEGFLTLWRGAVPTMGRAMVVNAAQLATYSQAKEVLLKTGYFPTDGIVTFFCASMISGLVATTASMPVDIAKTRIQNMKTVNGKPEYTGALDVLRKIVKNEGVFALWKGFTPYYGKLGPHTVLMLVFLEQLTKLYNKHVLGKTGGGTL